jgi:hypothetical protein
MKAAERGNLDVRIATGAAASTLLLLRAGLLMTVEPAEKAAHP